MKKYLFITGLLVIVFSCKDVSKSDDTSKVDINITEKTEEKDIVIFKDSLDFDDEQKIIKVSHYENSIREGYSLIFDKKTHRPKYLVEYNKGKRDKVIIEFYDDGKIKSFRTANRNEDSQKMKFHENGMIESIGNTVKGKGDGEWYYFDEDGKLIKKTLYKNGQVLRE
ncbi:hypothetical protein MHTCC0001_08010 [Flavobacteriaceae bacterium MHTCC 0001]